MAETLERFALGEIERPGALVARTLREEERPYPALDTDVPLVLEARRGETLDSIRHHLSRRSEAVLKLLYRHGALLLRGLPIHSTRDFEEALFSIPAFRPMRGYFMAEVGRTRVSGSERIFHTNAVVKTGGTLLLGGFHSENYYSSDVPAFITFCCLEEPWMGGETGMVHMARAYQELDDPLKAKFEGEPSCAAVWPLSAVATIYGLDEAVAERFCREVGFEIAPMNGEKYVLLYKPNVLVHPHTRLPSLHLNVSAEIRGVDEHLRRDLSSAYTGPQWALHRTGWRHPGLGNALNALFQTARVLHRPKVLSVLLAEQVVKPFLSGRRAAKMPSAPMPPRVGRLLDDEDTRSVADAVRRHTNVFTWRRGDVLILDNLQMLHSGMPGFGSRRIEVAICNPLPIRWPLSSGVMHLAAAEEHESVFDQVTALAERGRSHRDMN
uniref:Fe(II)/alpha-ketoglutarate dependent oxygenase n=1 Tax=Jahnella sp. MSr9139 TaxID=1434086 RepID=V5UV07_9BACT|nr:Fe(II)/alpha-ketoglutarate dependent oxygenase [Jahnella sp. MSr9139]